MNIKDHNNLLIARRSNKFQKQDHLFVEGYSKLEPVTCLYILFDLNKIAKQIPIPFLALFFARKLSLKENNSRIEYNFVDLCYFTKTCSIIYKWSGQKYSIS